jgi:tRNA(adenine34) deaminase
MHDKQWLMKLALEQAEMAYKLGEVPVGAIVIDGKGSVIAAAHNLKEETNSAHGHAEILALNMAARTIGDWRLNECELFVTLEPCLMCLGAIVQYRVKKLNFGAYDMKGGSYSLGYYFASDKRLNHQFQVEGGFLHYDCSQLLSQFFKQKRPIK